MPSMHQASVLVFRRMLTNLSGFLDKAEAHASAKKIDPSVFLESRLAPEMFPLKRQVQIAADMAKNCVARLAGLEPPKYEDNEASFADLKARIAKTIAYLDGIKAAQIDGSETREIALTIAQKPATLSGQAFLHNYSFAHFYFHVATAYNILRHNGIEIGKRDFVGAQ